MPTINGIKMACAPCIRGHRSTKCNHADERLMVPVRKPGRPLSVCPHPQDQPCGCGSVTAAIPRKQQCGCGGSSHQDGHHNHSTNVQTNPITVQAKPIHPSSGSEAPIISAGPSPTIKPSTALKLQKPSRPQIASQKESHDVGNLDSRDVNTMAFDAPKRTHTNPEPSTPKLEQPNNILSDGSLAWSLASPKLDTFVGQTVNGPSDFENISSPTNATDHIFNSDPAMPPVVADSKYAQFGTVSPPQLFQSFTRHLHQQPNGVVIETRIHNVGPNGVANLNDHWVPQYEKEMVTIPQTPSQLQPTNAEKRSCCSPKRKRVPEERSVQEASDGGSCCSSKRSKSLSNPTIRNFTTSDLLTQSRGFEYMPQSGLNGIAYPTVFAYPPTYGSYQHPLEPAQWRQGVQYNTYAQMMSADSTPPSQGRTSGVIEDRLDTLHTCECGDGCECIGCAAHPFNEATQKYVRSAWETGMEQPVHHRAPQGSRMLEKYSASGSTNHAQNTNGKDFDGIGVQLNGTSRPQTSSPAGTPPDTAGDDPPLSASDFFFVNYSFATDGCGGDTQSCPCGDDCACLGCFIHHNSDSQHMLGSDLDAGDESAVVVPNEVPLPKAAGNCCNGPSTESRDTGIRGFDDHGPLGATFDEMRAGDERTCLCPPNSCEYIGCI